jgi:REP element-mobilizing transposase RayT
VLNLPAPPGFRGLDPDLPITRYERHLPHWRQPRATYVVTYRQGDSLPQSKLRELTALRTQWEKRFRPPWTESTWHAYSRKAMRYIEGWLDQGMGSCVLRRQEAAQLVASALRHFHGQRYELGCYVVMPNHVHLVVRPLHDGDPLEAILKSWKGYTSHQINRLLGQKGRLWQDESYDRIVRDEEHLYQCLQYIGSNAAKAGLNRDDCPRWMRPEWEAAGWLFLD